MNKSGYVLTFQLVEIIPWMHINIHCQFRGSFYQIKGRNFLTINTKKVFFRFNHHSLGVKPASALLQQKMDAMQTELTGVAYIDDIIFAAAS